MLRLLGILARTFVSSLETRRQLALENLALRHQLAVLQRSRLRRLRLEPADRALWVWLSRSWTEVPAA